MPRTTAERRVRRQILISESVDNKLRLILFDPLRNKQAYGSMSDLVDSLLRKWLVDQGVKL